MTIATALDHLEAGASELLAVAPQGWSEQDRERVDIVLGKITAAKWEHDKYRSPMSGDTAFMPPFGTIRKCRVCGCLVAGGPTACVRCAEGGTK
jgi:hypothetical protein